MGLLDDGENGVLASGVPFVLVIPAAAGDDATAGKHWNECSFADLF